MFAEGIGLRQLLDYYFVVVKWHTDLTDLTDLDSKDLAALHRIINFMGPVGYKTDQFFDIQSLLTTITRLLEFRNQMRKELTKEDKTRLFKAYLIICDEYLEQKGLISQTGDYTAEDMLRYYMPFALKLNTVLSIKDPLIELIKSKLFLVDFASVDQQVSEYVDAYVSEKKCCYPVLVYTDSSLDIEGFNYYLNNRFREILSHRKINSNIVVKDLVMVNVDTLIMFEKAFTDKKVKFDVLLNEYIAYKESKEQNRVVPFNKYLFQKCKQKGYFYKASYIVRDVIDEMIAREKQQVSKA